MRTIFYATTATALIAAAVACSDTTTPGDAGPGGQVCPTTVEAATKTSGGSEGANDTCHVDGYICVVGFPCGNFVQQVTCTCNGLSGKFACLLAADTDPNTNQIPDDTTDTSGLCNTLKDAGPPDTCPATTAAAVDAQGNGLPCHTSGEICTYATTCTSQPPPQDTCQCKANMSGNPGLAWSCDVNACP
jgi:hypothetical protein